MEPSYVDSLWSTESSEPVDTNPGGTADGALATAATSVAIPPLDLSTLHRLDNGGNYLCPVL